MRGYKAVKGWWMDHGDDFVITSTMERNGLNNQRNLIQW